MRSLSFPVLSVLILAMVAGGTTAGTGGDESAILHLTPDEGHVDGIPGVHLLMKKDPAGERAVAQILSTPVGPPLSPSSMTWYSERSVKEERVFQGTATVSLDVPVQVALEGGITVVLGHIGPNGVHRPIAAATGAPDDTPLVYALPVDGGTIPPGHVLTLTVRPATELGVTWVGQGPDRSSWLRLQWSSTGADEMSTSGFDHDGDGLDASEEARYGTDAEAVDTDRDGYADGLEMQSDSDPQDPASRPDDADLDGLPDPHERTSRTSALDPDTDGDGIVDCFEDPDRDGFTNCQEAASGTDPHDADTDGDGILDGGADPTTQSTLSSWYDPTPVRRLIAMMLFAVGTTTAILLALLYLRRDDEPAKVPPPRPARDRLIPHDHGDPPTWTATVTSAS
ncbi:MAG: MSCRAMM family adhesin SdrC [Euryarchaeota archaeon]|nr:MSCRAMM family adhesin SdrC [Euryarchaeota archaeon]